MYHCSVTPISRGGGRSAGGAAAYLAAEQAVDLHTGRAFDFTRKTPPVAVGYSGTEYRTAATYSAALDGAETRCNSRVAREVIVALPDSVPATGRAQIVADIAADITARWGVPVMWATHKPDRRGDQRNHHAHLLVGTRDSTGKKVRKLDDRVTGPEEVEWLRSQVAARCQAAVPEVERPAWDHRSFARRGLSEAEAIVTKHEGPFVTALRRRERAKAKAGAPAEPVRLAAAAVNDEIRAAVIEIQTINEEIHADIRVRTDQGIGAAQRAVASATQHDRADTAGPDRADREAQIRSNESGRGVGRAEGGAGFLRDLVARIGDLITRRRERKRMGRDFRRNISQGRRGMAAPSTIGRRSEGLCVAPERAGGGEIGQRTTSAQPQSPNTTRGDREAVAPAPERFSPAWFASVRAEIAADIAAAPAPATPPAVLDRLAAIQARAEAEVRGQATAKPPVKAMLPLPPSPTQVREAIRQSLGPQQPTQGQGRKR